MNEEYTAEEMQALTDFVTDNYKHCPDIDTGLITGVLAQCIGVTQTINQGRSIETMHNPPVAVRLGVLMSMAVEILYRRREDANRHN